MIYYRCTTNDRRIATARSIQTIRVRRREYDVPPPQIIRVTI